MKSQNTSVKPCKILDTGRESLTSAFVKYYAVITGDGVLGTPVFIIADPNVGEDEIDHYTVEQLGVGVHVGCDAEIVFTHDRSLNSAFYDWMVTTIVGQVIEDLRMSGKANDDDLAGTRLVNHAKFKSLKGQIFKIISSTAQLWLANHLDLRHQLLRLWIHSICSKQSSLTCVNKKVMSPIQTYAQKSKRLLMQTKKYGKGINRGQKELYIQGLLDIQRAMNSVITPEIIKKSYYACGMIDPVTGGYDLGKIISNFKVNISPEDQLKLVEKIPLLANILGENGELSEGDLDRAGIEKTTDKDGLDISRRRYVTITNPNVLKELREKATQRLQRGKRRAVASTAALSSSSTSGQVKSTNKRSKH
jgi:hypothetical protein